MKTGSNDSVFGVGKVNELGVELFDVYQKVQFPIGTVLVKGEKTINFNAIFRFAFDGCGFILGFVGPGGNIRGSRSGGCAFLFFWRFVTEDGGDGTRDGHDNNDRFFHKQCCNLTQIGWE